MRGLVFYFSGVMTASFVGLGLVLKDCFLDRGLSNRLATRIIRPMTTKVLFSIIIFSKFIVFRLD